MVPSSGALPGLGREGVILFSCRSPAVHPVAETTEATNVRVVFS